MRDEAAGHEIERVGKGAALDDALDRPEVLGVRRFSAKQAGAVRGLAHADRRSG
jgi:hypothetical protein